MNNLFSFTIGLSIGAMLCMFMNISVGIHRKKKVEPTIQINCTDAKCDTTYIYKF